MALGRLDQQWDIHTPLREQAYSALKDAILSGGIAPGERLIEQQVADSLGLSRNPVREAFRRLEQEGYLIATRSGIAVREVSLQELSDLYEVRVRLEGLAASLVARRASDSDIACLWQILNNMESLLQEGDEHKLTQASFEFHSKIYSLLNNRFLYNFLTILNEQLQRYRSLQYKIPHRGRNSVLEDRCVLEAISRRDSEEADRLAQEHIAHVWAHAHELALRKSPARPKEDIDLPPSTSEALAGES